MSTLGERLKLLRGIKGLKQTDMASLLNVTTRNYQEYEYNKVNPPLPMLIVLADYFNVSLDYLVGRDPSDAPVRPEPAPTDEITKQLESLTPEQLQAVKALVKGFNSAEED